MDCESAREKRLPENVPDVNPESATRRRAEGPSQPLLCVLIATICLTVYARVLANGFVSYDDDRFVTENPTVQEGLSRHGVWWACTTHAEPYPIALTWISHMLDCQLYGLRPWGHHLTSMLLHCANTLLLFRLLTRMTRAPWPAAWAALLFAVHPMHVESVAWVSERKDVLSAFFWMLTMGAYFGYARRPGILRYLLVTVLFVFGLAAKPMVMTLPAVLFALDYWPLGRFADSLDGGAKPDRVLRRAALLLLEKGPLLALSVADCAYSLVTLRQGVGLASMEEQSAAARLSSAVVAYAGYLVKCVWPHGMAPYYPLPQGIPDAGRLAGAAFLLAALTGVSVRLWRRRPYLLVGWGWYVVTLLPVIGLVHPDKFNYSDRYSYIPYIGVFIMAAWALRDAVAESHRRRGRHAAAAAAALVVAALSVSSFVQIGYWRDGLTLFSHAHAVTEPNFIVENNLGAALVRAKRTDEALDHLNEAVRMAPESADAQENLAAALLQRNDLDAAIDHCSKAIALDPTRGKTLYNWGLALYRRGDYAAAAVRLEEALRLDPRNPDAINTRAAALLQLGYVDEGEAALRDGLERFPNHAAMQSNLAHLLLLVRGKNDEAIAHLRLAVDADPNDAASAYELGNRLANRGAYDEAAAYYRKAAERSPNDPRIPNNLANALAASRRFEEAVAEYEKALALDPNYVNALVNLGCALAETGRVAEAAAKLEHALRLEPGNAQARANLERMRSLRPASPPS